MRRVSDCRIIPSVFQILGTQPDCPPTKETLDEHFPTPDGLEPRLQEVLKSPAYFLLGVNVALFLIGMFIETSAAIIVLAPILAPVAAHFGIDPVHFGLVMVVNLALGMITPPFGVNLFAACTVARISLDRIIRDLVPFVLVVLACLMVISYVPALSLTLRDLVDK